MIKTAIIYFMLDKCLDLLDIRLSSNFGITSPYKPILDLKDGDLVLCYRQSVPLVMGQSNGVVTMTHFEIEVWDDYGESWQLRRYAFDDFDELEVVADDDLLDEDDLDDDELEVVNGIEGGLFPVRDYRG